MRRSRGTLVTATSMTCSSARLGSPTSLRGPSAPSMPRYAPPTSSRRLHSPTTARTCSSRPKPNTLTMSRKLTATRYQATNCSVVIHLGIGNIFVMSDRLKPMWHGTVNMPCIDFAAITASQNWEPYLALMPVTATQDDFAAGDTSVGLGPSIAQRSTSRSRTTAWGSARAYKDLPRCAASFIGGCSGYVVMSSTP